MKLRIKGDSLRFRLLKPEVVELHRTGRIQQAVHFSRHFQSDKLIYAIERSEQFDDIEVRHKPQELLVQVPASVIETWATGEDVGIYSDLPLADGDTLAVVIEKDFACLDRSDEDNRDTFENPLCRVC
jgi:hypothetical protein